MTRIIDGLPASMYVDSSVYEAERRLVFAENWLYAANTAELPDPGSYVSLDIAGYPIVLIRQENGQVVALQNICRHRGAPVVSAPCGRSGNNKLICKYHGWSYNTSGDIAAIPHLDCIGDSERKDLSLTVVESAIYRGLIFVRVRKPVRLETIPNSDEADFQQQFDDLTDTIDESDCDLENYTFHSKMTREGSFNWKIWVEGYQECYHCPTIHPIFNKDFHLQKYRVENRKRFSIHGCERKVQSSSGTFNGLWLWVFPNLGMPVYEPCFYTLQVLPLSVGRTRLTYSFLVRSGVSEATIEDFRRFVDQITNEDISICEAVHKNMQSGLCEQTRLNERRENGVQYFHSLIRDALGVELEKSNVQLLQNC